MLINGSDPIDADSVNTLYSRVEKIKDSLINLMWKNAEGPEDRVARSLDEKRLQVLAGTVPIRQKTGKDKEATIEVEFYNAFGGKKPPTVVAMPDSPSPYGLSIKKVTKQGFTLVIRQFEDSKNDDLASIHYIAVGMP